LTKIPILTFRPAPAFPPAEFRRAKQNNFLSIFCILRAPFFLLKGFENCFALMFGLTPNGGNASHPQPAFGGQSRRAKIPSPRPPSFLPACLGFALKFFERADGEASIYYSHAIFIFTISERFFATFENFFNTLVDNLVFYATTYIIAFIIKTCNNDLFRVGIYN